MEPPPSRSDGEVFQTRSLGNGVLGCGRESTCSAVYFVALVLLGDVEGLDGEDALNKLCCSSRTEGVRIMVMSRLSSLCNLAHARNSPALSHLTTVKSSKTCAEVFRSLFRSLGLDTVSSHQFVAKHFHVLVHHPTFNPRIDISNFRGRQAMKNWNPASTELWCRSQGQANEL